MCSWRCCGLGCLRTARLRLAEGTTTVVGSDVVDPSFQGEQMEPGFKIPPFARKAGGVTRLRFSLVFAHHNLVERPTKKALPSNVFLTPNSW